MPNVTFVIPKELYSVLQSRPEIEWGMVVRRALRKEVARLDAHDRVAAGSKLTEKDAIRLGREVRKALARRAKQRAGAAQD